MQAIPPTLGGDRTAPLAPATCGRKRTTKLRDVVDAIFYIAQSGCQWRLLPKDFSPHTTVQQYFYARRDNGLWQTINPALLMDAREAAGREASPTAGVINSQSVKTTESGGPRGFDAGKKIKGRKRHILTNTIGLPVGMIVRPADIQDRDGAPGLLASVCNLVPWLRRVFVDGGYAGDKLKGALEDLGEWTVEVIKRSDSAPRMGRPDQRPVDFASLEFCADGPVRHADKNPAAGVLDPSENGCGGKVVLSV